MRDDEDDVILLPIGTEDDFGDSPVVVEAYFTVDGPASDGDDLESFGLLFEVLEELEIIEIFNSNFFLN